MDFIVGEWVFIYDIDILLVICSFVASGFVIDGRLLFCRRITKTYAFFILVVVVAFGMITYTVVAQSFLTFILRVGVWMIVSLIFTRVLAHGFCRAR